MADPRGGWLCEHIRTCTHTSAYGFDHGAARPYAPPRGPGSFDVGTVTAMGTVTGNGWWVVVLATVVATACGDDDLTGFYFDAGADGAVGDGGASDDDGGTGGDGDGSDDDAGVMVGGAPCTDCTCDGGERCQFECGSGECTSVTCAGTATQCTAGCPDGGCTQVCDDGATCTFDCIGGGCAIDCSGRSTCVVGCPAGGCTISCGAVATCTFDEAQTVCQGVGCP